MCELNMTIICNCEKKFCQLYNVSVSREFYANAVVLTTQLLKILTIHASCAAASRRARETWLTERGYDRKLN